MARSRAKAATRDPLQVAAAVVGAVFLLVGVLGFIPGATQNFDTLTFADPGSEAKLLGMFEVNILHNVVHLLFGIVGLAAARTLTAARNFLVWGGAVYLVVWIYGLFISSDSSANLISVNTADNWLHFGLGAGMVAMGLLLPRTARRS